MNILHNEKDFVVCIKPVGVDSEKQMIELLKNELQGEFYPVHRLDLNVSGVMVFAKHKQSAAVFSRLIQDQLMVKEYIAKVHGIVPKQDEWEDYLFKDLRKNKVFVVKRLRHGVKEAKLEFYRLSTEEDASFVHIRLHTGRTHQIRVQFSSRGYPLIGDHKYGSRSSLTEPMLYSHRISFPYRNQQYCFESFPDWIDQNTISYHAY